MVVHRFSDIMRRMPKERRERIERAAREEILKLDLREMRRLAGKTQVEVAAALKTTQGEISAAERRGDHRLSTIRRYVEALGGELEVVANFGDKTIKLHGV
jgi:transcriptional regulator